MSVLRHLRRIGSGSGLAAALGTVGTFGMLGMLGISPTRAAALNDWAFHQAVDVPAVRLSRIAVAPETFDAARPDLGDLRLIDPAGDELPYLIEFPLPSPPAVYAVRDSSIRVEGTETRIEFAVTNAARLAGISLESPAPQFLKAVTIEGATAAGPFQRLVVGQPIFRQGTASRLLIELKTVAPALRRLRVILDDSRSSPIAIAAVSVHEQAVPPPVPLPSPARIVDRLESPGATRLTVDLGAGHLPIVGLRLATPEPLFTRRVTVLAREWMNDEVKESALGAGTIFRVALEGQPVAEQLECPMRFTTGREIVVALDNGDSPPLPVSGIEFQRSPVGLVFLPKRVGTHQLFSGNARALPPRYDVAQLAAELPATAALTLGGIQGNSDYHPAETLPEVSVFGAEIDPAAWRFRRAVQLTGGGVKLLELPAHVLAYAQAGLADLRLVSAGRQVVYLLDRTASTRALAVEFRNEPIRNQPQLSRWRIRLPYPHLPVTRLRCEASQPLFQRDVQLWEERVQPRDGQTEQKSLGHATWVRTSARNISSFEIPLTAIPSGDTIFLGTDNGDNAGLDLKEFQAYLPVVRMLFKAPPEAPLLLCYGNLSAPAAHYDLSLIAGQVLAAPKSEAILAGPDPGPSETRAARLLPVSALFYAVLAIVVIGLLVVITRLLPKPKEGAKPASVDPETSGH